MFGHFAKVRFDFIVNTGQPRSFRAAQSQKAVTVAPTAGNRPADYVFQVVVAVYITRQHVQSTKCVQDFQERCSGELDISRTKIWYRTARVMVN